MFTSKYRRRESVRLALESLEGRKLLSTASPTFTFYPDGHVASEVAQDNLGHQFNESFDEAGHVTAVHATSADGSRYQDATYTYDGAGTLRSREIIDAAGNDSIATFRANGTVSSSSETFADGSGRIDTYNSAGQLTTSITSDANGDFVSMTNDTYYADGHLKTFKVSNADGSGYAYGWADTAANAAEVTSLSTTDTNGNTHTFVKQDGGFWV